MKIARTIMLMAAALALADCQPAQAPPDSTYTVDGKPLPSVASSDPAYAAFPEFKAMAVNDDGTAFLSIGQCSAVKAKDDTLADCRSRSAGQTCRLAAIGNADASGLDESGVAQLIRQHARFVAKGRQGGSGSSTAIPVILVGADVPYVKGFASGRLYYDPSIPCVGEVAAQTKDGLTCDGVWQFRRRLDAGQYPVEGDLDFECANGARITGTYVTFASGFGAARVADEDSRVLFAVYGPDVTGVNEGREFQRLWHVRAALAPEATIFQQPPAIP